MDTIYSFRLVSIKPGQDRLEPSMSRKGNCWDNAVAESFFSSLKKERIKKYIYKEPRSSDDPAILQLAVMDDEDRSRSGFR